MRFSSKNLYHKNIFTNINNTGIFLAIQNNIWRFVELTPLISYLLATLFVQI